MELKMVNISINNSKIFRLAALISNNHKCYNKFNTNYIKLIGNDIFATDGQNLLWGKDIIEKKLENSVYLKLKYSQINQYNKNPIIVQFLEKYNIAMLQDDKGRYFAEYKLNLEWYDQYDRFLKIDNDCGVEHSKVIGGKSFWIAHEVQKMYKNVVYFIGNSNSNVLSLINPDEPNLIIVSYNVNKDLILNQIQENNRIRRNFIKN